MFFSQKCSIFHMTFNLIGCRGHMKGKLFILFKNIFSSESIRGTKLKLSIHA